MGIPQDAFYWIGSTSHPRSHIVVDHPYSHFKASNRAGNDGKSVHDLDLHGHESDVKRASKPSYCILSRSTYSMALSHESTRSRDPIILPMPFCVIPSPTRHRPHPHHRPFQLACLSSGIPSRVSRRSFGYTVSEKNEQSIRHFFLRHSSGEREVKRGKVSVRSSPTTLSVDQCTISMRLLEAFWENETHRLRDSTLHTPHLTCGLIGNGLSGTLLV